MQFYYQFFLSCIVPFQAHKMPFLIVKRLPKNSTFAMIRPARKAL